MTIHQTNLFLVIFILETYNFKSEVSSKLENRIYKSPKFPTINTSFFSTPNLPFNHLNPLSSISSSHNISSFIFPSKIKTRILQNIEWNKDYKIQYKLSEFFDSLKTTQKGSLNSSENNSTIRIGILDSGISQNLSKQFPQIHLQDFTGENDPFDHYGHGTFSMSVP